MENKTESRTESMKTVGLVGWGLWWQGFLKKLEVVSSRQPVHFYQNESDAFTPTCQHD